MSALINAVQQFLDSMDWKDEIQIDEEQGRSTMATSILVEQQPCRLFVETADRTDLISVFLYAPFHVRADKITQACVLANAINLRNRVGHIEIMADDGRIRFVHTMDFEGCTPSGTAVHNMVDAGLALFSRRLGQLAEVAMTPRGAAEILAAEKTEQAAPAAEAGEGQGVEGVPEAL